MECPLNPGPSLPTREKCPVRVSWRQSIISGKGREGWGGRLLDRGKINSKTGITTAISSEKKGRGHLLWYAKPDRNVPKGGEGGVGEKDQDEEAQPARSSNWGGQVPLHHTLGDRAAMTKP